MRDGIMFCGKSRISYSRPAPRAIQLRIHSYCTCISPHWVLSSPFLLSAILQVPPLQIVKAESKRGKTSRGKIHEVIPNILPKGQSSASSSFFIDVSARKRQSSMFMLSAGSFGPSRLSQLPPRCPKTRLSWLPLTCSQRQESERTSRC